MKTLSGKNMAILKPYTYDAGTTRCFLCTYDPIYDYDGTWCIPSSTSSTSVTTTLTGAPGRAANEACFPDPAGGHEWDPSDSVVSCYGYRYYNPDLGRWLSRDPIEDWGGCNYYGFSLNAPVDVYDHLGLFGKGRRRQIQDAMALEQTAHEGMGINRRHRLWRARRAMARAQDMPLGHSDFTGGDVFDYYREDEGWSSPWFPWNTGRHFQELHESADDVDAAIQDCDQESFERHMHRGQDYYSHHDQGYRWAPLQVQRLDTFDVPITVSMAGFGPIASGTAQVSYPVFHRDLGFGHLPSSALHFASRGRFGENPDACPVAWQDAEDWTQGKVAEWYENCCKCGDDWNLRSEGPCE